MIREGLRRHSGRLCPSADQHGQTELLRRTAPWSPSFFWGGGGGEAPAAAEMVAGQQKEEMEEAEGSWQEGCLGDVVPVIMRLSREAILTTFSLSPYLWL